LSTAWPTDLLRRAGGGSFYGSSLGARRVGGVRGARGAGVELWHAAYEPRGRAGVCHAARAALGGRVIAPRRSAASQGAAAAAAAACGAAAHT
jgi:hypothetical protein